MLDARRMYIAMFTPNLENLRETLAEVITEHSLKILMRSCILWVTVLINANQLFQKKILYF
jgi:hypothetical protein